MIKIKELTPIYKGGPFHKDFRELINYTAKTYGSDKAFTLKHKKGKEVSYETISFTDFRDQINMLGTGMMKMDLAGKRVAIIGKNSYSWILSYFAVLCGVGICVPLDKGLPYDEAESSLARSRADVLIFDHEHADLVRQLKASGTTSVSKYICMTAEDEWAYCLPAIMEDGRKALADGFDAYLKAPIDGEGMTIILFTSGTTSMSKAVMLSQQNITSNIYAMEQTEDIRRGDVNMAFLPYHHTFGSTGQVLMLARGVSTAYCDGLKYLQKNIVEYKVSIFVCVPLLIEAIYKKILASAAKQGKAEKLEKGIRLSRFLLKFGIDVRRRLFKDVLEQLGGNLRYVISGASAIDPAALQGFNDLGITAVQGLGLTEASPVLSAENSKQHKNGSIGLAMFGVDLRIIDENEDGIGELIARGPNIMLGYYENEEETAKILEGGWLHTGDLASVDEDGYLFIRGRKKNVIVLKNGKNIYPEELEILISNLPYVTENMVYGEPRHKDGDHKDLAICAKIVYDPEYMKEHFGAEDQESIEKVIKADLDKINEELPTYKHILRLNATDKPMIKTTTGKVKRFEEIKNS